MEDPNTDSTDSSTSLTTNTVQNTTSEPLTSTTPASTTVPDDTVVSTPSVSTKIDSNEVPNNSVQTSIADTVHSDVANDLSKDEYETLVRTTALSLLDFTSRYDEIREQKAKSEKKLYWAPSEEELLNSSVQSTSPLKDLIETRPNKFSRKFIKDALTSLRFDPPEVFLQQMQALLSYEKKDIFVKSLPDILKESVFHIDEKIILWQGDICTLAVDAIVNAANEYMLGCFTPNHPCIDNAIHCAAGPRLRKNCREIMAQQGHLELTGKAKITPGYNLPSKFVLHTVGPIIHPGAPLQPEMLASCYIECLNLAKQNNVRSIAFCCISTGVFGYPNIPAALTTIKTVEEWLSVPENSNSMDTVIFNVFKDVDKKIYEEMLSSGKWFQQKKE